MISWLIAQGFLLWNFIFWLYKMRKLETLFIKQKEMCGRISRSFINFNRKGKAKMNTTACQTRLAQFEKEFSKFSSNHDAIVFLPSYNTHKYTTSDLYDQTQQIYFEWVDNFKAHLIAYKSPSDLNDAVIFTNETSTVAIPSAIIYTLNNSLPKIHIHKFRGKHAECARLRDLFLSLIIGLIELR